MDVAGVADEWSVGRTDEWMDVRMDVWTVGRICGKSFLYAILLADAATNSGFFHGTLAASARRTPCSGILPQMRPVGERTAVVEIDIGGGERMTVMGWMSVGKKGRL